MKKVALGMSGGVDSSLAAHLLVKQGYEVTGVYLDCWHAPGCRSDADRADALKIALELDIPFKVLDFKEAYKNKVVDYFFDEYQAGRTPNPDVMCNQEIKFGLFYDWAMTNSFDFVATGHYAKTQNGKLFIPKDTWKDQTYFLHVLTQDQLQHTIFPLADLTKNEVRAMAKERGLIVADKPDSVGICFIGEINVKEFLKERLGEKPGEVIDINGQVIGSHDGIWFYTIGQRHGFVLNESAIKKLGYDQMPPLFVIDKLADKNQLIVGEEQALLTNNFVIESPYLIDRSSDLSGDLLIRIRHTGELIPGKYQEKLVYLTKPAKGVAPGQSAVFYQGKNGLIRCLGGGVISQKPPLT